MSEERRYYLCLERTKYADGSVGDVEVCYQSMKPNIGYKYEFVFWCKGYDTAVGYEAYKALCDRIGKYNGKISDEFAKDLAEDVVKNFDDDEALWDYETKITKIKRELDELGDDNPNYALICKAMNNIEEIVKHQ